MVKGATDVYYMKFNFHGPYSGFKCNSTLDKELCDGNFPTFPIIFVQEQIFSAQNRSFYLLIQLIEIFDVLQKLIL